MGRLDQKLPPAVRYGTSSWRWLASAARRFRGQVRNRGNPPRSQSAHNHGAIKSDRLATAPAHDRRHVIEQTCRNGCWLHCFRPPITIGKVRGSIFAPQESRQNHKSENGLPSASQAPRSAVGNGRGFLVEPWGCPHPEAMSCRRPPYGFVPVSNGPSLDQTHAHSSLLV